VTAAAIASSFRGDGGSGKFADRANALGRGAGKR
jgi:hypothetical protein